MTPDRCEACKTLRGERWTNEKCGDCMPQCMERNRDAVRIFMLCHKQMVFAGLGSYVDINHVAVHEAMKLYDVPNKKECFEKVMRVASHMINIWREEQDDKREEGRDGK